MKIVSIVEGHGEQEALPKLLRRLQIEASCYGIQFSKPIRRHSSDINNRAKFQTDIRMAMSQTDCAAILVLFDLDDGCPKDKAAELTAWAQAVANDVPCAVVLAYREYEAWFLAALESLRGYNGIAGDALAPDDPEGIRGAKQHLQRRMARQYTYAETVDQVRLTERFDLAAAYHRSRSFRRLVNAFGQLLVAMGQPVKQWPPAHWLQSD